MSNIKLIASLSFLFFVFGVCKKKEKDSTLPASVGSVEAWITKANGTVLFEKQTPAIQFNAGSVTVPVINIDTTTTLQTIDGFGYTLTGGSAYLLNRMVAPARATVLKEFFGNGPTDLGVSYLRISIGASDLSPSVFSYNDLPSGQTDPSLTQFTLAADTVDLIPVLKEILQLNPSIKIMGSPWSAPAWMKSNGSSIGGNLLPTYYSSYAQYFVKYIQLMKSKGITIDAVTVQNEPEHGGNNPSMLMTAAQQTDFIKNHLGPAFGAAGITTKIIVWDHNCDNPNYPISIMNDPAAKAYVNGAAFHLYAGNIGALSGVHAAHPDKNLYFTEQWTGANGNFGGDLIWHTKNVIIGAMRNWSRIALEWNLANDPTYGPHTPGGCTECKGAVTIDGSTYTRNVSYYIIAQASKLVIPGSVRIGSDVIEGVHQVTFKRPDGKKVMIALNEGDNPITFAIGYKNQTAIHTLSAQSVATYSW
ncbi:MAG: glucosylceramidase [Bacteroidetes bacterium]|nr:glucosylceramidase [Bacteroidota bacterium]